MNELHLTTTLNPEQAKITHDAAQILANSTSSASSELSKDIFETLSRSANQSNRFGELTLDQVNKLSKTASFVSNEDLMRLLSQNEQPTTINKEAAAVAYTMSALHSAWTTPVNELTAALLSDAPRAAAIKDETLSKWKTEAANNSGDILGLMSTFATSGAANSLLSSAEKYLPLPTPAKIALSVGIGIAVGGVTNNYFADRKLTDIEGYRRDAILSGGLYVGAGFMNAYRIMPVLSIARSPFAKLSSSAFAISAGFSLVTGGSILAEKNHIGNIESSWKEAQDKTVMLNKLLPSEEPLPMKKPFGTNPETKINLSIENPIDFDAIWKRLH